MRKGFKALYNLLDNEFLFKLLVIGIFGIIVSFCIGELRMPEQMRGGVLHRQDMVLEEVQVLQAQVRSLEIQLYYLEAQFSASQIRHDLFY